MSKISRTAAKAIATNSKRLVCQCDHAKAVLKLYRDMFNSYPTSEILGVEIKQAAIAADESITALTRLQVAVKRLTERAEADAELNEGKS